MSDKTYILILIIMILGLSVITYLRFQEFRMTMPRTVPEAPRLEMPKFEMPTSELEWQDVFFPESDEKKEWVSPDGKLKLEFTASWQEMDQSFLKYAEGTGIILAESKILLFAHRFKHREQALALFTVSETSADKNLRNIIEEIEENIKTEGGEIEIISLETEIKDKTASLEMILKYSNQSDFYSKGEIIFDQEKTFLIFFASPQKDWLSLEAEAKEIFDSIRLIE